MLVNGMKASIPSRRMHDIVSVPAPVGGLNARDSYAAMAPTDAVQLTNWIPDVGGIRNRKGYTEWAINFPSSYAVESVFGYVKANTTFSPSELNPRPSSVIGHLFAATKAGIYEITNSTNSPTLVQALSGNDNAGWISHAQFNTAATSYLLVASEADGFYTYDGTTWAAGSISGSLSRANIVFLTVFKRRVWFVERNSTKGWYLAADTLSGAATAFDFGPQFKNGGFLAYLANWTIDAGEGVDDFLVAVSSMGDVLVYKGTDPASSTTFGLVGTWFIGQIPVGRRGWTQYGGDLLLLSSAGIVPISYVTRGGAGLLQASNKEYTSKIRTQLGRDLQFTFALRGWELLIHPNERLLLVSVPNYSQSTNRQYAMSTVFNEWAVYDGIPIYCMGNHTNYAFAGTRDGRVLLLATGQLDNVGYGTSTGTAIRGTIIPAFSYFGKPVLQKHMQMVRCNFLASDTPEISVNVNVDFSLASPTATPTAAASTTSKWDTALWDSGVWSGAVRPFAIWASVNGLGFSAAASIVTSTTTEATLTSVDYMFTSGGPL